MIPKARPSKSLGKKGKTKIAGSISSSFIKFVATCVIFDGIKLCDNVQQSCKYIKDDILYLLTHYNHKEVYSNRSFTSEFSYARSRKCELFGFLSQPKSSKNENQ